MNIKKIILKIILNVGLLIIILCCLIKRYLKKISKIDEEYKKKKYYYSLLKMIIEKKIEGRSIAGYLRENGKKKIAVYGYGDLGKILCKIIDKEKDISISCIIDRNVSSGKESSHDVVSSIEENRSSVDAVIVTPFLEYDEIRNGLIKHTDTDILSLEDIVYEM